MLAGDLAHASSLLDAALAEQPDDPAVWVAIARLRYRGGEHLEALDAAARALELGPRYAPALLLRAQLVRDAHGLAASLPWYDAALAAPPDDSAVQLDHAATLGDLGRHGAMLEALPRSASPEAHYILAVLAARAGNTVLARSLLERAACWRTRCLPQCGSMR
ncbi:MAG: tetratricopeptide repeat protein [Erythrobacter sp.]